MKIIDHPKRGEITGFVQVYDENIPKIFCFDFLEKYFDKKRNLKYQLK